MAAYALHKCKHVLKFCVISQSLKLKTYIYCIQQAIILNLIIWSQWQRRINNSSKCSNCYGPRVFGGSARSSAI